MAVDRLIRSAADILQALIEEASFGHLTHPPRGFMPPWTRRNQGQVSPIKLLRDQEDAARHPEIRTEFLHLSAVPDTGNLHP